jgi:hypothetical protein
LPLPDWWTSGQIELNAAGRFFMDAFWKLSTCRPIGMGYGPIPWTAVDAFATRNGFDAHMSDYLADIVQALDAVYLKWVAAEQAKDK